MKRRLMSMLLVLVCMLQSIPVQAFFVVQPIEKKVFPYHQNMNGMPPNPFFEEDLRYVIAQFNEMEGSPIYVEYVGSTTKDCSVVTEVLFIGCWNDSAYQTRAQSAAGGATWRFMFNDVLYENSRLFFNPSFAFEFRQRTVSRNLILQAFMLAFGLGPGGSKPSVFNTLTDTLTEDDKNGLRFLFSEGGERNPNFPLACAFPLWTDGRLWTYPLKYQGHVYKVEARVVSHIPTNTEILAVYEVQDESVIRSSCPTLEFDENDQVVIPFIIKDGEVFSAEFWINWSLVGFSIHNIEKLSER